MTFSSEQFASLVRRLRLARGLSQTELSKRSGLSKETVSRFERGSKSPPRVHNLVRLRTVLQEILPLTEPEKTAFSAFSGLQAFDDLNRDVIVPAFQETTRMRDALLSALEMDDRDILLIIDLIDRLRREPSPSLRSAVRDVLQPPKSTAPVAKFSVVEDGLDGQKHRVTTYHPIDPPTSPHDAAPAKKPPRNRA